MEPIAFGKPFLEKHRLHLYAAHGGGTMEDQVLRLSLAYGLGGVAAAAGIGWYLVHRRKAYWHKLRQRGDSKAKLRELGRHRR